jgi:Zn-dependent protease
MLLTIFILIVLFFSIIIHEIAHGSIANSLGDSTAKDAGRLTLNPLKHIDPVGTILLPMVFMLGYMASGSTGPIVGWAKPVPVNPFNLRDRKWGMLKVSLAGPSTNFLIALIFGLLIRFIDFPASLNLLFWIISFYNFAWGIFNLVPIFPLDGSHILFSILGKKFMELKNFMEKYYLLFFVLLFFFGIDIVFRLARILYIFVSGQPFGI